MKKIIVIFVMLLLTQFSALAHPGSLDSNGGHYNRKTGEYHYHSGEHTEYSGNSSSSTYYPFSPEPTPTSTPTPEPTPEETLATVNTVSPTPLVVYVHGNESSKNAYIYITLALVCVSIAIYQWRKHYLDKKTEKSIVQEQTTYKTETNNIAKAAAPEGYEIGKDGLPYKTNRQYGWGREFNVFVTNGGEHFHRSRCKIIKGKKKNLIHRYNAIKKYKPCTYCKPKDYIDDWYIQYKGADKGREQISLK